MDNSYFTAVQRVRGELHTIELNKGFLFMVDLVTLLGSFQEMFYFLQIMSLG